MSRRKTDDWLQPSLLDLDPSHGKSEQDSTPEQTWIEYDDLPPRKRRVIDPAPPPAPPLLPLFDEERGAGAPDSQLPQPSRRSPPPSPLASPPQSESRPKPLPKPESSNDLPWLRLLDDTSSSEVEQESLLPSQPQALPTEARNDEWEEEAPRRNRGRHLDNGEASRLGSRWRSLVESERWVARLSREERLTLEYSVTGLEFRPGAVEAGVRKREGRPLRVQLRLQTSSPAQWARVARSLSEEPELLAEVRQGQLPPRLVTLSEAEGLSLVPKRLSSERSACTCGDRRGRCEHVLAVHLAFARLLETDPAALFIARGARSASLVELVDRIHDAAPGSEAGQDSSTEGGPTIQETADPFALPQAPEPDWSLLDAPRPPPPPAIPAPDAWYGDEPFEEMIERLLDVAAS